MSPPRIAVLPSNHRLHDGAEGAASKAGAEIVGLAEADSLIWVAFDDADGLAAVLGERPDLAWVQLPFAGIEPFAELIDGDRVWSCGKGVYAEPVAEHALALALAGMRGLVDYARAETWSEPQGVNLLGASVTVLGGGGITEALLRLLGPFGCTVTVVRKHADATVPGAHRVVGSSSLLEVLPTTDLLVLALALTPETVGIVGRTELDLLPDHAWLVNVARGAHVVTEDLVAVLREGGIGGAALDVTEPEPLPAGHPLWSEPRCIITPHIANTPEMGAPLLYARITENVRRWAAGDELIGLVDPALGY